MACSTPTAFDRHQIWVAPDSQQILIHPATDAGASDLADVQFLGATRVRLALPPDEHDHPDPRLFTARYRYFEDEYEWVR